MIICIQGVLSGNEVQELREMMSAANFVDGKKTAGWHAKLVKNNLQMDGLDARLETAREKVENVLMRNELFRLAARPKQLSPMLFSKYAEGMEYGTHVDDAYMGPLRSDLSFTVFLSRPQDCDGGELVMDLPQGEQGYKLEAGDMILYPSTTLHRVEPVRHGTRLAAVGWVQSMIRRSDQRELLFDLESARLSLFRREGKSAEFDLLSKTLSNLLRMWGE
jgi:PKHD-type hydroxylase